MPPSSASTCAIPRICSGSRPTCTPSTSSRPSSSSATVRGRSRRRRRRPSDHRARTPATAAGGPRRRVRDRVTSERGSSRTTRCSATGDRQGGVRHPAPIRAVLERRPANRVAGVPHGVERPGVVRTADRYVVQGELPQGPLQGRRPGRVGAGISREMSLQENEESGTQVRFGDMQLVPIATGWCTSAPSTSRSSSRGARSPS